MMKCVWLIIVHKFDVCISNSIVTLPGESITPGTTGSPTEGATESPTKNDATSVGVVGNIVLTQYMQFCHNLTHAVLPALHECNCISYKAMLGDRN